MPEELNINAKTKYEEYLEKYSSVYGYSIEESRTHAICERVLKYYASEDMKGEE